MWMAYVTEKEITDLKSGVENIRQEFSNLAFDAHHEAVYGMGKFLSMEECNRLGDRYMDGESICDNYLDGGITITQLVQQLKENDLHFFLSKVREYLPPALMLLVPPKEEGVASDDEESQENEK